MYVLYWSGDLVRAWGCGGGIQAEEADVESWSMDCFWRSQLGDGRAFCSLQPPEEGEAQLQNQGEAGEERGCFSSPLRVRIAGRRMLAKFAAAGSFHWELDQEAVYSHSSFKQEPWPL